MKKRFPKPSRSRTESQSACGGYEQRRQGKCGWAGISVAEAFRARDYWLRMPAERQFYDMCRKVQRTAAGLAGAAVNGFQPKVKPQLSPCYAGYPSALVAVHAAAGLTAFLEYQSHLGQDVLETHLQKYLRDPSVPLHAGIDPGIWIRTVKHLVKTVQTRLLLEELSRSLALACVEAYRLFAASQQTARFDTVGEIVEAEILYGDVLLGWESWQLHPTTRAILHDLRSASEPFLGRLHQEKLHGLIPLGEGWVRALGAKLIKYLPPPQSDQERPIRSSAPRDNTREPAAGQAVRPPVKEPLGEDEPLAPLDAPRPPLAELPSDDHLAGAILSGKFTGPAPDSGGATGDKSDPIADFSKACAGASAQRASFEDLRSDLVRQKARSGSFEPGPMQGNPTEGHELQVQLGPDHVAGGQLFDRPVELSNDFAAYERLLDQSRPITEALCRALYPNIEEIPVIERYRTSGTLDPARLALAEFSSAVFRRNRVVQRGNRRGKPVVLIACDASGSLNTRQMAMLKVLAASWLNSTFTSGIQVLAALYHSGEIRANLSGPLVQWIYHPQKTPAIGRRDAARALVSLPESGTGCQSDVLSVAFLLDEARRLARGRMVYMILLTDTAWNVSFHLRGKSGKDEMIDLLSGAYAESDGKLHVTLVALGQSQASTGLEQVVDKVITVSDRQLNDFAAVAEEIAVYVGETMKERKRFAGQR